MKTRPKHFSKFASFSVVLGLSLLAGGCASNVTTAKPSATTVTVAQAERPEQMRVPGEEIPEKPVQAGKPIKTTPVPSSVHKSPSVHIDKPRAVTPVIPSFEIPGPARKKNRGLGVPAEDPPPTEEQFNLNLETITPNSWTGSSGSFLSTDFDDNGTVTGGFRFIPPDSHAAAGPNHVVNVVNVAVAIHQKNGALATPLNSLKDFFYFGAADPRNPTTFTFDPKVIYDQYAGRFLIVTLEQTDTTSRIFLAVSKTDDPTGEWWITVFDAKTDIGGSDYWADYPGFAVDDKAVYITANMFPLAGGDFGGNRLWIIDKGETGGFYAGLTASIDVQDPTAGFIETTLQPAHMFGNSPFDTTSGTFLLSYSGISNDYGLGNDSGTEEIQVISVTDPLGTPTFTRQFINLGNIENLFTGGSLPDAPQAGTGNPDDIEVNDRRSLNAVWRNNDLWLTTTINPNSGTDSGQTTAYWVRMNTTSLPTITLADSGQIGGEDIASGTYTFFPSIAVNDNGDAVIGFSASASSIFAGAYFVTREAGDSAGTTSASQTVAAGLDTYVRTFSSSPFARNRWGDYSGAAVDPIDSCLWVYNQYADTQGTPINGEDGRWGTAYARTCACSESKTLPNNQWVMFSMACNPGQNTVADFFTGLDTIDYGTTWVVYERDAANNVYVQKTTSDTFEDRRGYWFYTEGSDFPLNVEGMYNLDGDLPLESDVQGRFNLLGHPFSVTIDWADVSVIDGASTLTLAQADPDIDPGPALALACDQVPVDASCIMSRKMQQWNGSAFQIYDGITPSQEGNLAVSDAFWVKAYKSAISLRIPSLPPAPPPPPGSPTPLSTTSATASTTSPSLNQSSVEGTATNSRQGTKPEMKDQASAPWYARLIVESGKFSDAGNALGQLADSLDSQDGHDLEEPVPFGSTYLTIVFPHDDWKADSWGYTTDFHALSKKPSGTWRFAVKASTNITDASLRWAAPDSILRKAKIIDEQTGKKIKLKADGHYSFNITGGIRYFRFEL